MDVHVPCRFRVPGLLILLLAAALAASQPEAASVQINVQDPSGAPMRAAGRLENLASGAVHRFQTDNQGRCTIESVAPGRYRLELSQKGFATQSLLLDVQSATPMERTIVMALGATADHVEVVAATPLAGIELTPSEIPAPVQTATARDMQNSGALNLSDFLNRRLDAVNLNENQGNPYQADLNYRGYTASPLLGTPQGLSVYMDGVRQNQPFGDVVSWDLIPQFAISEVSVMPGSNPVFGLNTLGGAISMQTKDGLRDHGTTIELSGGSFGRKVAQLEQGGSNSKGLNWYVGGNMFFEDGWREASPSDVRQFFGKLGWTRGNTALGMSVGYANNSLTGNGLQEQRLLAADYNSVYTIPDITANRAPSFSLTGLHSFGSTLSISGIAYYRYIRTATLNGDLNEDSLDQSVYQPSAADIQALIAAGYSGFPTSGANASNTPFPSWRCIAQALERDEPGEKCNGLLNRTHSEQHNYGISTQVTWLQSAHGNQLTVGAAYDGSVVNFAQSSQLGYLNPDRSITGVNAFGDGVTGGNVDGVPFDTRVDLHGVLNTASIYATDTLSLKKWSFTLSGRYNHTSVDNHDRVEPIAGAGSLTGVNSFGRFNPAAGVTYNLAPAANLYFGYSEGSRAPTSIELGCADPTQPCKLPNALAGDPPLQQVVTRTFEAGVRGGAEGRLNWRVGWFHAENHNDILFVASTQTGFGYFKNFGETRRQGVEARLDGHYRRLSMGGGYTFLDATYQSTETVDGSSNSTNDGALSGEPGMDGIIEVQPGDRIPLIPQHMLKAYATLQATRKLSADLDFIAVSTSYARGNENNMSQPDGVYYLGPGTSPGYGVVNVGARYQATRRVQLFVQINNLLNHRYYTAAQLGPTGFTARGAFIARPLPAIDGDFPVVHATFYAPGAPIGAWAGVRIQF
ncbi:MAG TPA: TonB-dependent receptor [Bryobacteraceae bacterium]|nr:TonB-dependent receptor [Bryobacteraceae bacterium]